ncbi:MAG: 2-isopropylmalate synthase, partial [Alphaproteobacteria bacterium]
QTDYDFLRLLIDEKLIPEDVTIQVLTQSREPLIRRTFEAIRGARRAIVHLYNSTSAVQRRVVFGLDRAGIVDIAVSGARLIRALAAQADGEIVYQYSPESFTGTELDFAVEITEAVMDVYQPTPTNRLIVNLPATVEMATPNTYADQIEWFCRHVKNRDSLIISIHPHNDRGTGVAAAEFALMAGADRVEGTLFGNGERTGNVDIVTLALNMFTQGVDPGLDLSDIDAIVKVAEYCTQMPVHPRHPYAGALVYTAFSGSHQDAINKGLKAMAASNSGIWDVPYLPIDPEDVGRSYEAVIRINSQSGKGGIAFVLEQDYGLVLPRHLQIEFSKLVQQQADAQGNELTAAAIWAVFEKEYLNADGPLVLIDHLTRAETHGGKALDVTVGINGQERKLTGHGSGPIDCYADALRRALGIGFDIVDYREQSTGTGAGATAMAYVELKIGEDGTLFGVGTDKSIVTASLKAITSGVNRAYRQGLFAPPPAP